MIIAHFVALLALAFTAFGQVSLDRLERVSACPPISIDWSNGDSNSALVSAGISADVR